MKLTHPESRQTIDVPEDSAGPYLRNGWTEKATKAKKKADTDSGDRAAGGTSHQNPERGK